MTLKNAFKGIYSVFEYDKEKNVCNCSEFLKKSICKHQLTFLLFEEQLKIPIKYSNDKAKWAKKDTNKRKQAKALQK